MIQKHIVISMIAPVAVAGILIMTILAAAANAQESNSTGNTTAAAPQENNSTGVPENTTSPIGSAASNNTGNTTSTGGSAVNNATTTGVPKNMKNSNNETAADFTNNILAVHNRERAAVGVPPLVWNDKLAADAKAWADNMAVTHKFVHCGYTPGCDTHGEGENMQAETFGDTNTYGNTPSTAKLQDGWVNEKNYYQQWATNSLPKTANWTGWFPGHYNQMVWNTTKEVGCATGFTQPGFLHGVYLICRYSPPGNIPGQKPY